MQSIDSYMNIQLSNTEEYIDRKCTGTLGQILIRFVFLFFFIYFSILILRVRYRADLGGRCNNVLYVRAADKEGEGDKDTKMEG